MFQFMTKKQCHAATVEATITQPIVRIRPLRVAARRQRELMAIIVQQEAECAEWMDEELLNLASVDMPADSDAELPMPVVSVDCHLNCPWGTD